MSVRTFLLLVFLASSYGAEIRAVSYDTIVVGLGAAGATAAGTLARGGRRVLALEAAGRAGGRVRTERCGDGVVELGAEWMHGTDPSRVYDLAIQNNVSVRPQQLDFEIYRSDGTQTDIELLKELTEYCLEVREHPSDRPESRGDLITRKLKEYLKKNKPEVLKNEEFVDSFLYLMNLVVNNYDASSDWRDLSALSPYKELQGNQYMTWHRHGYKTFFEILLCVCCRAVTYDTVVVGLGAAGATAAGTLARSGQRVLVLEAAGRAGGRVRTERCGDGVVELGAEWMHGTSPSRVYDLAIQNNVSVRPQELNEEIYRSDGTRTDIELLRELTEYCLEIREESSDRPESVGDFITRKFKEYLKKNKPEVLKNQEFVDNFLALMNLVVNNYDASNDWGDLSALSPYEDLQGNQYVTWHRHGYKTFFEILLNTYNNGPGLPTLDIKYNTEVTSISWPQNGTGDVVVKTRGGEQYTARNVIVTVSLGVLKERHTTLFNPPLPQEKIEAIDFISMGVLDKIILTFDTVFFPQSVMFYWTAEDKKKLPAEDKWMADITGASAPSGCNNTLTLWTCGESAKLIETLPEDLVKRKAVELLQRFLGPNVTVPEPIGFMRSTWFSNPLTRGSYTYDNMQMINHPNLRQTLASPLLDGAGTPRVLFAGEATDTTHFATVHGASDTGYREAMRLLPASKI